MNEKERYQGAAAFVEFLPSIIWELASEGTTVIVWSNTGQVGGRLEYLRRQRSAQAAVDFVDSARDLFTRGERITVQLISAEGEGAESLESAMTAVAHSSVGFGGCPGEMESDADEMAGSISLPIRFPIPTS